MLDVLVKVASNNTYLAKMHENFDTNLEPIEQMHIIYNYGKDLDNIIHEEFNPWVYVANYPETIYQFWSNHNETLNEIFVTYVYISFGWLNNLPRNFSGLSLYTAYNIIKPKIIIHFTGKMTDLFNQYLASKSHVDYLINEVILHYSYYEIYVDRELWSDTTFYNIHKNILKMCSLNVYNEYPHIFKTIIKISVNYKLTENINSMIFGNENIINDNYSIVQYCNKKNIL